MASTIASMVPEIPARTKLRNVHVHVVSHAPGTPRGSGAGTPRHVQSAQRREPAWSAARAALRAAGGAAAQSGRCHRCHRCGSAGRTAQFGSPLSIPCCLRLAAACCGFERTHPPPKVRVERGCERPLPSRILCAMHAYGAIMAQSSCMGSKDRKHGPLGRKHTGSESGSVNGR
jgi:hypothetical protein